MKRLLILLLLPLVAFGASAKFRWGPTVGVNFSNSYWKQDLVQRDMLTGFNAGLMGEVMIPGIGFGFDFGLRYSMRGSRVHFGDQVVWSSMGIGTTNLYIHQIDIPVNLRFKWTRLDGFENTVAPFAYAGPVFNIQVANSKCDAIERSGGSVGIQVALGAELFRRWQVSFGYLWDVTYDMNTRQLDNFSSRLQGWFINAAVLF